ncbi:hypothetical protein F511_45764 [Dorcoceras hygrometricum]|uniref:Uncharacterized protein n=1 Tax=Dorcoceras hygrometricum TaxID=472368 RepID=A0A2Z6ZWB8_9LAMI|nr:hypothetical protein F511_45764 [Dorcoceras hygrometricum]
MEALVDVARAALRCAALRAMVRALPPRFRGGGAAVVGRRSAAAPPPLRRISGNVVTAGLNSSRV